MSNLAYLPGAKADQERRESPRGPQVEDGFTRIANELFEALIQAPLTDRERRVALAVVRLTYGWNKKADRLADSQIAEVCHLPRQKVNGIKQDLIAKKILKLEGPGHGLLSINKHFDEWELVARHTPKRGGDKKGDTVPHGGDKVCTPRGCTPKTKDILTLSDEREVTADAETEASKPAAKQSLPGCPHMEILDLWAEIMPDKRQHSKTMWHDSARAAALAARWKMGFTRKHADTGKPLYTNLEEGLDWWRRFFGYLRRNEFLMRDHRWFDLGWVCKRENFIKILERNYEEDGE